MQAQNDNMEEIKYVQSIMDIHKLKNTTVEILDMSEYNCNIFPSEILEFKNLKKIFFRGNIDIPEDFFNMKIKELCFEQCDDFSNIMKNVNKLVYLKSLIFTKCTFVEFPDQICNMINLEKLMFHDCNMLSISIPKEIEKLLNINKFSLSGTTIKDIKFYPKNVKYLCVYSTNILELLNVPHNLIYLDISNTNITHVPNNLSDLEYLNISNTNIDNVHSIYDMTNLKVLRMTNSNITEIPKSISKLKNLVWLFLDNQLHCDNSIKYKNTIKELPGGKICINLYKT